MPIPKILETSLITASSERKDEIPTASFRRGSAATGELSIWPTTYIPPHTFQFPARGNNDQLQQHDISPRFLCLALALSAWLVRREVIAPRTPRLQHPRG